MTVARRRRTSAVFLQEWCRGGAFLCIIGAPHFGHRSASVEGLSQIGWGGANAVVAVRHHVFACGFVAEQFMAVEACATDDRREYVLPDFERVRMADAAFVNPSQTTSRKRRDRKSTRLNSSHG